MSVYFSICVSLSVGLILGAVGGGVKEADKKGLYAETNRKKYQIHQ